MVCRSSFSFKSGRPDLRTQNAPLRYAPPARHSFIAVPESSNEIKKANTGVTQRFMSESESAITDSQNAPENAPAATETEEITYQAVEKDGVVTAIWEMKGRRHLRTIDPRSRQGREILNLYTTEDVDHTATSEAATS